MSKAVEAAHLVYETSGHSGDLRTAKMSDDTMRAIIRAFLDAAAEDEEIASGVWTCAYDTWAEFGASDHDGGRAAILSLKQAVEG